MEERIRINMAADAIMAAGAERKQQNSVPDKAKFIPAKTGKEAAILMGIATTEQLLMLLITWFGWNFLISPLTSLPSMGMDFIKVLILYLCIRALVYIYNVAGQATMYGWNSFVEGLRNE
jgi:hypothetical protein